MAWLPKHRREVELEQILIASGGAMDAEILNTRRKITHVLLAGLEVRNQTLGLVEHSARVAEVCDRLAVRLGLSDDARADLRAAAELHEVGMIAIPPELVTSRARFGPAGVARIRAQAQISAEVARTTQSPRTVRLIEEQYTDFVDMQRRFGSDEDTLLAAILRVVDAFDAVTFPRPYQKDIPDEIRLGGILEGQGTRYHPDIVDRLCELDITTPES